MKFEHFHEDHEVYEIHKNVLNNHSSRIIKLTEQADAILSFPLIKNKIENDDPTAVIKDLASLGGEMLDDYLDPKLANREKVVIYEFNEGLAQLRWDFTTKFGAYPEIVDHDDADWPDYIAQLINYFLSIGTKEEDAIEYYEFRINYFLALEAIESYVNKLNEHQAKIRKAGTDKETYRYDNSTPTLKRYMSLMTRFISDKLDRYLEKHRESPCESLVFVDGDDDEEWNDFKDHKTRNVYHHTTRPQHPTKGTLNSLLFTIESEYVKKPELWLKPEICQTIPPASEESKKTEETTD